MLSRVADSMFWMSRYIERAENVARFIDVNQNMTLDLCMEFGEQWEPLVITSGDEEPFRKRYGSATKENVMQFLTFDPQNPNSILSCLVTARENARTIRESITSSMWEELNSFYLMVQDAARHGLAYATHDFFNQVRLHSHMFVGVTEGTLSWGESYHFCRVGRLLERADKMSRILDVKSFILLPSQGEGSAVGDIQWAAVLRSASGLEMYRKRHGRISPEKVVDFLMLDRNFPRSVHFCLDRADESIHCISGTPVGTFGNAAEQRLGKVRSELAYTNVQEILADGLHEFFDRLQVKLNDVGDSIYTTFFALRPLNGSEGRVAS